MKLVIELVPSTCWYKNLRLAVGVLNWDYIRKKAYKEAGYRCAVCGADGKLNCHEVWEYDDVEHIQKLIGFTALCDLCHFVKHIGFAGIQAAEGKLDFDDVIRHFMRVNECSLEEFEEHERKAWQVWEERSLHKWRCEFGEYGKFIS
jgi:hypothetical protein